MMKIAIHQPLFIPWIGYFDKILKADIFVFLDHVQYTKGSWINRNRIKAHNGVQMLTVPVARKGLNMKINEAQIDPNNKSWAQKHLKSIIGAYKKASHFEDVYPYLERMFKLGITNIAQLDIELISWICDYLGIKTNLLLSSELDVNGSKSALLLDICHKCGADTYIIGMGGNNQYMDKDLFRSNNISILSQNFEHPKYNQLGQDFISGLSILDLLFNYGKASLEVIENINAGYA